jgi:hypothetical protein
VAAIKAIKPPVITNSAYVPDNDATTGGCNVIPFGTDTMSATWANQKYQTMVTAADLGNPRAKSICGLAFAPCGTVTGIREFDTISIRMGQTNSSTLSTTFSANMGSAATVLSQRDYRWVVTGGTWDAIGLENNYLYNASNGANLVIEITVTGNRSPVTTGSQGFRTGARERLYAFGWTGSAPATGTVGNSAALKMEVLFDKATLSTYGVGCKGSNGQVPTVNMVGTGQIGTTYAVSVTGALPNARGNLSIGFSLWNPPLDLAIINAPGCMMYFNNLVTLPMVYTPNGTYSIKLPVPKGTRPCERAYFQFFVFDRRANPLGVTSSDYGRILTGN